MTGKYKENPLTITNDNTWKRLICRAVTCKHTTEHTCLCGFDGGLEIEEGGRCLHYTREIARHPITGDIHTIFRGG